MWDVFIISPESVFYTVADTLLIPQGGYLGATAVELNFFKM